MAEEELNKLKKAKGSKTLQLHDLNPQHLRVWVDMRCLANQGVTELLQRGALQPIPDDIEFN